MICIKCKKEIPSESVYCMYCGKKQSDTVRTVKHRGNGQGSVYKLANGKYRAAVTLGYYVDAGGKLKRKVRTKEFIKKSDAIAYLPTLKTEVVIVGDMNLHDLREVYMATPDYITLSKSQKTKLKCAWNRIVPFEYRMITSITVADMEELIINSTSTFYPAHDMKVMLSHLFVTAIKREILQFNKTEYVDLPYDAPKAKRERWTQEEVELMWKDYEENPFTMYPLIMCYSGMRFGELFTMQLENIHLDESYMIGGIKTDAGIDREIPIHERIKPLIERAMQGKKRKLVEMDELRWYHQYHDMVQRTGIRDLPPQTCRHFYFSSMTEAGVQGGIIAEAGGHASYSTTMKNYVRIPLEEKLKAVNTIK